MNQKTGYFKLGLFILSGIALLVAVVLVIGGGSLFRDDVTLETYFNESVQGLSVGSKVKFRGVVIGEVSNIGFTYNRYELDKPLSQRRQYVMVEARLSRGQLGLVGSDTDDSSLQHYIQKGLRVRLAAQGLTGTSYLELDYVDPKTNAVLPIDWTPENVYVPSSQGTVTQLVNIAESFMRKLDRMDLDRLMTNLNRLVDTLDTKLEKVPMDKIGADMAATLSQLRTLTTNLNRITANPDVASMPENLGATAKRLRQLAEDPRFQQSLDALQRTLIRAEKAFAGREQDISAILENLRQTSENLRDLTETAKRYPSGVLFGEPPPPSEVTR
ncbi:MAG: MlaD family protein [Sulfuricellaceae bacterium]|jgi:ABC-type transporter Mla subunit MlaD